MNCRETARLLGAYLDDELDLGRSPEVESHLEECAACAAELSRLRALGAAVREQAPYYPAPVRLRRSVTGSHARAYYPWIAVCATAACLLLTVQLWRRPAGLTREVVAGHIRSLEVNHLVDVPSSDRHTVKPWFAGKLDYAPDVVPPEGFELVGGRLDYLAGRAVAALIYRRRQHTINVFTWPDRSADTAAKSETFDGFHVVHWRRGGMDWWAVSDLASEELEQLAR